MFMSDASPGHSFSSVGNADDHTHSGDAGWLSSATL